MSADYHDYVIKDGRFVGRFEEMYQTCADPWQQTTDAGYPASVSRAAAILLMQRHGVRAVLEYGCGLGYYTERLSAAGFDVTGVDISETAIHKARARRPDLSFAVGSAASIGERSADAILFAEITWYILQDLPEIFRRMTEFCKGALFVHNLVFYPQGQQQYGTEYFSNLDEWIAYCPFTLLEVVEHRRHDHPSATTETTSIFRI